MMPDSEDEAPDVAAVLQSMTLMATLSTAADVHHTVSERRAGRDPSAQEPTEVAAPRLKEAAATLQDLLMQLLLNHATLRYRSDQHLAAVVRHFDERMKVQRVARLLQEMHQRLLSLYPEVSEELVEEARIVLGRSETLIDSEGETFGVLIGPFLDRALGLVTWVRHEVA
jgi:hypothetical protein